MEWISLGSRLAAIAILLLAIHVVARPFFRRLKIQPQPLDRDAVRHDLLYGASTLAVGVLVASTSAWALGRGALELELAWPGAPRFALETAGFVLLFDAYFYALHRLLHTGWLYDHVHAVHHRSTAPTALTALAFHPVEALSLVVFFPIATWLLPLHATSLAAATAILSVSIVLAHCGHEIFPRRWHETPVLRLYVTPLVHDTHHTRTDCNYGATLSLFDRAFGTFELDADPVYGARAPHAGLPSSLDSRSG